MCSAREVRTTPCAGTISGSGHLRLRLRHVGRVACPAVTATSAHPGKFGLFQCGLFVCLASQDVGRSGTGRSGVGLSGGLCLFAHSLVLRGGGGGGSVARDTSCGILDLSGTRRSAWLYKPGKIARIAIGSSRVTLGNPAFCG